MFVCADFVIFIQPTIICIIYFQTSITHKKKEYKFQLKSLEETHELAGVRKKDTTFYIIIPRESYQFLKFFCVYFLKKIFF